MEVGKENNQVRWLAQVICHLTTEQDSKVCYALGSCSLNSRCLKGNDNRLALSAKPEFLVFLGGQATGCEYRVRGLQPIPVSFPMLCPQLALLCCVCSLLEMRLRR